MKKNNKVIAYPLNCEEKYDTTKWDKRRIINVDLDHTLTKGEPFWEIEPTPNIKAIKDIRRLYMEGNVIIIHTARLWETANLTVAWLIKYKIPFHGIYCQKGSSDIYIDDKSVSSFKMLNKKLNEEKNKINNFDSGKRK